MPTYTFNVVRTVELDIESSVQWRVEGVGETPLTADLFQGGVLPSGTVPFAVSEASKEASFVVTTGPVPTTDRQGRIVLLNPLGCKINPVGFESPLLMRGRGVTTVTWALTDIATNYITWQDNALAEVEQTTTGVRLTGGAKAGLWSNSTMLVSRLQATAPCRIRVTHTKLDAEVPDADNAEMFSFLGFLLRGLGTNPVNLAAWPPTTLPRTHTLRDNTRGGRLVFNYQVPSDTNDIDLPNLAIFDAGVTNLALLPATPEWEQTRNVAYTYQLDIVGDTVTLSQTAGGTTRTASVTHADIATKLVAGNIVFHVNAGRSVLLENLTVEPLNIVTPVEKWDLDVRNFVLHVPAGNEGRVTWGDKQLTVAGAANTDAFNLATWYKEPFPDHYRISFTYEKNEDLAPADGGGRWINFWHGFVGGVAGAPVDVSTWTAAQYGTASDNAYGDKGKGGRISFDTETTVEANRNEARNVQWDSGADTRPTPTPDPPAFPMSGVGTSYDIDITRQGTRLTIANLTTGHTVSWTDSAILRPGSRGGFKSGRGRGFILRHRSGVKFLTELGPPIDDPVRGDFPFGPWRKMPAIPTSGVHRKPVSSMADLNTKLASAQADDFFLMPAGGNFTGTLNLTRAISEANGRYWITTDTTSEDPASFCKLNGSVSINGARGAALNGFQYDGGNVADKDGKWVINAGENIQIERGLITRVAGGGVGYSGSWLCMRNEGEDVHNVLLGFLQYQQCSGSFFDIIQGNVNRLRRGPTRILMTHIHFDRTTGATKIIASGRNPWNALKNSEIVMQYCLDKGSTRTTDTWELKFNGHHVRFNTFDIDAATTDSQWKIRHGRIANAPYNEPGGGEGPALGNLFEGNLIVIKSGGRKPTWTARGRHHKHINNWAVVLGATEQPTRNSPLAGLEMGCFGAQSNGRTFPENWNEDSGDNRQMSAYECVYGGNRGFTITPNWDDSAKNFRPENCIANAIAGRADRNTAVAASGNGGCTWNNLRTTAIAGADYDKVPTRLLPADVGPRTWRSKFNVG